MSRAPGEAGAVPVSGQVAAARTEPLGKRSIEQQLSVLGQIFKWAEREGMVASNPVPLVEIKTNQRTKKKIVPLEREEVVALLDASETEKHETQLKMLASLGLRLGELLALEIGDFNPSKGTITVERTLTKRKGKTVVSKYPKTNAGNRTLKLGAETINRLERQVARATPLVAGESRSLLFCNSKGRVQSENNFRRDVWAPAIVGAGLSGKGFTPHSLRHTFASELIAQGVPITKIAYLLGHANPATTLRIYASVFKRHQSEEADLADFYSPTQDEYSTQEGDQADE
jgi:integrase